VPLPLHDEAGAPAGEGGNVTCGTCHDPHRWSSQRTPAPAAHPREVVGSGQSRFLRLPNDDKATLCVNCHGDKAAVLLSKHNLAISAPAARNALGRGVGESGPCGGCHLPHKGGVRRLWAQAGGTGRDEGERRCTGCHRSGGIAERKIPGSHDHPLGVDPGKLGARPALPLFAADGRPDAGAGRVSCATCHDPHQWQPGQPASALGATANAEGHAGDSFLRRPAAPAPTLCVECHLDKAPLAGTKHDLAVTAPQATNRLGQTVGESGPCGQCHLPHGGEPLLLWARQPGGNGDNVERLCRSCHSDGRLAGHKQPVRANHPPRVTVSVSPAQQRLRPRPGSSYPVFAADGRRSPNGIISCPTCHNPHQWQAVTAAPGNGRREEGDARSSFLRNPSDYILCADCHGLDALFRYKYFHADSSRLKHPLAK
jgi:hypothetical protein